MSISKFPAAALSGLSVLLLAATAIAASAIPYQPRPKGTIETGYTDVRKDAAHYTIVYSAADEAQARKYLELRAAQLAQAGGYPYFRIDSSGTRTLRVNDNEFQPQFGAYDHGTNRDGTAKDIMDYIPKTVTVTVKKFYDVWGEVTFLTGDQARGAPGAIQTSEVLARESPR